MDVIAKRNGKTSRYDVPIRVSRIGERRSRLPSGWQGKSQSREITRFWVPASTRIFYIGPPARDHLRPRTGHRGTPARACSPPRESRRRNEVYFGSAGAWAPLWVTHVTMVPPPTRESTRKTAPIIRARYSMMESPNPGLFARTCSLTPTPSSATSSRTPSLPLEESEIVTVLA